MSAGRVVRQPDDPIDALQRDPLNDHALLFLNATVSADRTGRRYDKSIPPDETIADPDQVVQRAIAWLRGH